MQLKNCLSMQARAKKCIPGMTQLLSKRPDRFSYGVWPTYFSKAKGANIWDLDGNCYLDMSIGGIGATVLGYADTDVDEQVKTAIDKGVSSSLNCPEEVLLAEELCSMHDWADMVRFSRTGGEAMAMAVRIARTCTGKSKVVFCGYHGWHDWYLAANLSGSDSLDGHLIQGLKPEGVPKELKGTAIPFHLNDFEEFNKIIESAKHDLAAIVMEPIRNIAPDSDFMKHVQRIASQTNSVLIIDEISAGFRLTTGGAHLVYDFIKPDMAVFSKALGNGYPIAAVIGKDCVMKTAEDSFISSTNWTERVGPVAALATIKKHREKNVARHLQMLGNKIQTGWKQAGQAAGLSVEVGGIKPMSHFSIQTPEWPKAKAFFIQEMLEKGILASNLFYAMYAHTLDDVAQYLDNVADVFQKMAHIISQGSFDEHLKGEESKMDFQRLN